MSVLSVPLFNSRMKIEMFILFCFYFSSHLVSAYNENLWMDLNDELPGHNVTGLNNSIVLTSDHYYVRKNQNYIIGHVGELANVSVIFCQEDIDSENITVRWTLADITLYHGAR